MVSWNLIPDFMAILMLNTVYFLPKLWNSQMLAKMPHGRAVKQKIKQNFEKLTSKRFADVSLKEGCHISFLKPYFNFNRI